MFVYIQEDTRLSLVKCLPVLVKCLSIGTLKTYLTHVTASVTDNDSPACVTILEGLYQALRVPDPPHAVTLVLYKTVEQVYGLICPTASVRLFSFINIFYALWHVVVH